MNFRNAKPHVLVSVGMLGIAGYELILRLFHPRFMDDDFAHGFWFGVCLGLQLLGLVILRKNRTGHTA